MVDNKELAKLSADFMSCKPVSSSQDVYQMASNLADIFMSTVQYNEETPSLTVDGICKNMTQPSAQPYTVLQSLNKVRGSFPFHILQGRIQDFEKGGGFR